MDEAADPRNGVKSEGGLTGIRHKCRQASSFGYGRRHCDQKDSRHRHQGYVRASNGVVAVFRKVDLPLRTEAMRRGREIRITASQLVCMTETGGKMLFIGLKGVYKAG